MTLDSSPTVAEVGAYFSGLYANVMASPAHHRIGRAALGDGFVGQVGFAGLPDIRRLAELAGAAPGKRILDLCCGNAGILALVAQKTGAAVVGVDCCDLALRFVYRRRPVVAGLVTADVDHLPFAPASFDGVMSLDGFSPNFNAMAREVARVLRPGGALAMLVSLEVAKAADFEDALSNAGFQQVRFANDTPECIELLRAWLVEYRRERVSHIREVGATVHSALVSEIESLLNRFAQKRMIRAYVTAVNT